MKINVASGKNNDRPCSYLNQNLESYDHVSEHIIAIHTLKKELMSEMSFNDYTHCIYIYIYKENHRVRAGN